MSLYYLTIIIPAYNEEKKIERDIREGFKYIKGRKIKGEVIVSTDGVTDQTNDIVKNLQKEYPDLHLISKKEKIGKGAAIREGVKIARGKYVMFADAGYCVPFKFVDDGIQLIESGYDCALASRALALTKIRQSQPLYRQIGSTLFRIILLPLAGVPHDIKDTQCGFKIYTHKAAEIIFKELQSKAMVFDVEAILRAKKHNLKMAQFPVEWTNDPDTKFNPATGGPKVLLELLKMKLQFGL